MKHLVLLAGLALAGCAEADPHASFSADFGNAVNANIAAQVVNADPASPGTNDTSGKRVDKAIDRYLNNKTYQPRLPLEGGRVYDQAVAQPQ
jgi:hypothetical protein